MELEGFLTVKSVALKIVKKYADYPSALLEAQKVGTCLSHFNTDELMNLCSWGVVLTGLHWLEM